MRLISLSCHGFRNLEAVELEPHPRFNILEGGNGQGKTNLLEATYLLAAARSFREPRNRELVRFGDTTARVRGRIARGAVIRELALEIDAGGRRCAVDGRIQQRLGSFMGQLQVVLFGPDDLGLSKSGPLLRRRFLDRAIFAVEPAYFDEARSFQAAVRHRNALLRAGESLATPLGRSFEDEYVRRAARVWWRRQGFLERFFPIFRRVLSEMSAGELLGEIRYLGPSEAGDEDVYQAELRQLGERHAEADRQRAHTTTGPLTDDLELILDGRPLRRFGSQGQHRSFVLALKIAELEAAATGLGEPPVLLLDDVSSELDADRQALLMNYLDRAGGQVFITTTDRRWVRLTGPAQSFTVEKGRVRATAA
jgi:DNA replication and repair protein RecF